MIVERSMHPQFLSNTYLVAARDGSGAALVDAGGPVEPLLALVERRRLELSHVLLTHHHHDHVAELGQVLERHPGAEVLAHPRERERLPRSTGDLVPGEPVRVGRLELEVLHTPGHTAGMVALVAGGRAVFTGDTLFRRSVGGVHAPGHTTYEDLRRSIMDTLMALAPETVIHPGHTEPSTVAEEWAANPFVRVWRGIDAEGDEPCTAMGRPATLILLAPDYDGGHKAWVRWPDGQDDIVPGSAVRRGPAAA